MAIDSTASLAASPRVTLEQWQALQAVLQGNVDIAFGSPVPAGFVGDPLMRLRFIAVAHPYHPHRLGQSSHAERARGTQPGRREAAQDGIALCRGVFAVQAAAHPAAASVRLKPLPEHSMVHRLRKLLATMLALAFAWAATIASASFHGYQINQIFSNADGTIQFVKLFETLGLNGENFLAGHTLTSTQGGTTQTYTFNKDLPGGMGGPYGMESPTAHSYVLIATPGFVQLGLVTPDYVIPNGFLPLTNGTINYAGVDQVSYAALPTDGTSAIDRNSTIIPNLARNFAGDSGSVNAAPPPPQAGTAVEYYYDVWNFFFETSFPDEIAFLDGGGFGGAWKRTGQTFHVWPTASNPAAVPTCRFFSLIYAPKSSHFYTPFAPECESLKAGTAWQFESIAFYVQLVDDSGVCPAGTIPLYRAYNNGMGEAGNHRFTTSLTILNQMLAAGWVAEGHGITKASACLPP